MQLNASLSPSCIASEQTFATCNTFLRVPRTPTASGADVAIMGVPFDLATSNRPGARLGPAAVRAASAGLADLKAYPGGFDPLAYLNCVDLGDLHFDYGNPHTIVDRMIDGASRVIEAGAFLIAIGGDHFISYPLLKAHAAVRAVGAGALRRSHRYLALDQRTQRAHRDEPWHDVRACHR